MKNKFLLCALAGYVFASASDRAVAAVDFVTDIQPIFQKNCVECHGPDKQKGKLRLDVKEVALSRENVIVLNDALKSELYRRITLPKDDDDIMPSEGDPLTKSQTDLIRDWINQGAPWPDSASAPIHAETEPPKNEPILPSDFQPGSAEQATIAKLSQEGIDARLIALNIPWRGANLRLLGTNVTDAVLAPMKDVHSLVELNLATTPITDAGLAAIKNLPYLQRLHLELTSITDAGLAQISGLTNLVYLNLYGTAVTDEGLAHLHQMGYLKKLYVWQTKVTEAGEAKLKEALPDVEIVNGSALSIVAKKDEDAEEKKAEN